ncbi:MAG TPA: phosphate ABC transporter substrate-binding protein PstS [Acidimicrobiales bacterium]|nr:phosphate ABC transporter substrate-binding protein PstS [Acidimicrobiales bacterium]
MLERGRSGLTRIFKAGGPTEASAKWKTKVAAVALVGVSTIAAACSSSSNNPTTTAAAKATSTTAGSNPLTALENYVPSSSNVALGETGSSLLYPMFNIWVPLFNKQWSNYQITTASTGSGTGISSAANGTVQIGASDAYLSQSQTTATPGLMNIPLVISAQMINYNIPGLSSSTNLKLSGAVLSKIYQGTITNWNDPAIAALNPGVTLPSLTIVPLHRSDGSGDTFLFSTLLTDTDANGWGTKVGEGTTVTWPTVPGALAENGNGGMVSGCKATPGCVAYIGISYLSQTQGSLGEAQVQNKAGNFELPTQTAIAAEAASFASSTPASGAISLIYGPASGGYPIINYEYAIVNKTQSSPTVAQGIKSFLAWCMDSQGGATASNLSQVGFQPLPPSAIAVGANLLSQITG